MKIRVKIIWSMLLYFSMSSAQDEDMEEILPVYKNSDTKFKKNNRANFYSHSLLPYGRKVMSKDREVEPSDPYLVYDPGYKLVLPFNHKNKSSNKVKSQKQLSSHSFSRNKKKQKVAETYRHKFNRRIKDERKLFTPTVLKKEQQRKVPMNFKNTFKRKMWNETMKYPSKSNLPYSEQNGNRVNKDYYRKNKILEKFNKISELVNNLDHEKDKEIINNINEQLEDIKNLLEYSSRRSIEPIPEKDSQYLRRSFSQVDNSFKNRIKYIYYNTSDHDLPKSVKLTMRNINEMKYVFKYNNDKSAIEPRIKLLDIFEDIYSKTMNEIPLLKSYFEEKISSLLPLHLELDLPTLLKGIGLEGATACYICRNGIEYVWHSRNDEDLIDTLNQPVDPFVDLASKICTGTLPYHVCKKMINLHKGVIYYIMDHSEKPNVPNEYGIIGTPPLVDNICYVLLQGMEGECGSSEPLKTWHVQINPKPPNLDYRDVTLGSGQDITVAQITDIHYDNKYKPGTPTYCPEVICCRENVQLIENIEPAGELGSIGKCDIPLSLVQSAFEDVVKRNVNYVIFNGDIVPHNIWDTSKESNSEDIQIIFYEFKNYFKNTPVYPVLGNHDVHPLNLFAPRNVPLKFSSQWLYDLASEIWPQLIFPDQLHVDEEELEEVTRTIKDGGYYTIKTKENIRIIVLNNNVCYKFNWWLGIYAKELLLPQLQWLVYNLDKAEKHKELVHILLHIPPAISECSIQWIYEYQRIVDRYSHVIRAQFCGHTHYEELHLLQGKDEHIVGAIFNGGSLTTYRSTRPNYRIYNVDKEDAFVKEFTSYTMPLDIDIHEWTEQYKFADLFEVPDLSLSSMEEIYDKLVNNDYLRNKYVGMKYKETTTWENRPCDQSCQNEEISQILFPYPKENYISYVTD